MGNDEAIGRQMEILLVEDNLVHARLAMQALQQIDIKNRVTLIPDGGEAAEFLFRRGRFARAPQPDLILLDLRLPNIEGADLLASIRESEELRGVPVVVMTASEKSEDRERCLSLDVDGYIVKPIDLDSFLDLVRKLRRFWRADVVVPKVR